jgi:hypothetical protein
MPVPLAASEPDVSAVDAPVPSPFDASALEVTRLRALPGPNYWRLAPVIACDVRLGALEGVTSAELPGFTDRLLGAMPTLAEHPCSVGRPGGFVERLGRGTHLPHILEHVALEFQSIAGTPVHFGRVVASGDESVRWVIVEYEEEDVGLEAMREAAELVRACLAGGDAYAALRRRRRSPPGSSGCTNACASARPPPRSSRRRGGAASPCGASTRARSCSSGSGATCGASRPRSPTSRA